jgi:hypothetical protein
VQLIRKKHLLDCVNFKLPLLVIENFQVSKRKVTTVSNYMINHSNLIKYSSSRTNLDKSLKVKKPKFMNNPKKKAEIGRNKKRVTGSVESAAIEDNDQLLQPQG